MQPLDLLASREMGRNLLKPELKLKPFPWGKGVLRDEFDLPAGSSASPVDWMSERLVQLIGSVKGWSS